MKIVGKNLFPKVLEQGKGFLLSDYIFHGYHFANWENKDEMKITSLL